MKLLKKNQIIVCVIALMLVSAGYLNYSATHGENTIATSGNANQITQSAGIGDAKLVSSNGIVENTQTNTSMAGRNEMGENSNQNMTNTNTVQTNEIAKETTGEVTNEDEYFTSSRLGRDTMYSQMIESYQKILESDTIAADQKAIAQTEIQNINQTKNAIMIAENLIKNKEVEDVIIFVNDQSISVIVKAEELTAEQIAQIQNIVARELKAEIDNIHISTK